jgi:hypothetical protein
MQQNDIYNIPLPRGPGPKKKDNERGINFPGWIKTSDSSRGQKISTRDGSVIDSRFILTNFEIWIALRTVCSF